MLHSLPGSDQVSWYSIFPLKPLLDAWDIPSLRVKDAGGTDDTQTYRELGFSFNSIKNPVNLPLLDTPRTVGGFQFGINWKF